MTRILSADEGFRKMGEAYGAVEDAEERLAEVRKDLKHAETRLTNARQNFDRVREATLEHCPALATGYSATGLTETVAIQDGKVTVVPIGATE